ncbi:hypothetical protein OH77DRAFT_1022614 [Trametes cingulata]|nr:hypothetical protein OH77DRAFT_1022614 [Trametes cingulata]
MHSVSISSPGPLSRGHVDAVLSALLDCYACDRVYYPAVSLTDPHHFPPPRILNKSLLRSCSPSADLATTYFPPLLKHLLSRRMDPPRPSHDRAHSLGPLHTQHLPRRTALNAYVDILTRRRAWLVRDMFSSLLLCSLGRLCASARTRFGYSSRLR